MERVSAPQLGDLRGRRISRRLSAPRPPYSANPRLYGSRREAPLDSQGRVDNAQEGEDSGEEYRVEEYEGNEEPPGGDPDAVAAAAPVRQRAPSPGMLYPPYLVLLGAVAFLLYTALYLADTVLLYLTFVPGTLVKAAMHFLPVAFRFRLDPSVLLNTVEGRWFMFFSIPTAWRTLIGTSYQVGAAFRYIDTLLMWSFALDAAAFCTSLLLVFCMWWHGRELRPPGKNWYHRVLGIASPWSMFGSSFLASIFSVFFSQTPLEDINRWEVGALVCVCILIGYLTAHDSFLSARIPYSCQAQMGMSLRRLRPMDPYQHHIHFIEGMLQLVFLFCMLRQARKASEYYHRYINYYFDRETRGRRRRHPHLENALPGPRAREQEQEVGMVQ